ncbi:MAG TPA: outer membrane protein assembly factor BamD [Bacteroidia bacterium]|nr:outer membrane protein assembly factor BamD [Bacteroidia bacterium]HRS57857.1 outer membrane protein assembly factor BamD [Bacteroidia bacterium]HRU67803.1 outer membrane protein assembly factor BamD [Bacteroidia bacterium]
MRLILKNIAFSVFVLIIFSSCSEFQKILKSDDINLKYATARELFDKEEYQKVILLLEDILPYYRVSSDAELIAYMYAYCHFGLGNNLVAAQRFKLLYETYPYGKYAEQALFNYAYCTYLESPPIYLDQSSTKTAIEALQFFINRFPSSDKVEECNKYIDELYKKLEQKDISVARLYYKLEDYRAAIWTLTKVIEDYPTTEEKPELAYLALDAHYKLAVNSIESKKTDRFQETIAFYQNHKSDFENTKYAQQALNILNNASEQLKKLK